MSLNEITKTVWQFSDGIGNTPSNAALSRNDDHYRRHLAQRWAEHTNGTQPGSTFILNRLPLGYSGQQKTRANSHIDRCKSRNSPPASSLQSSKHCANGHDSPGKRANLGPNGVHAHRKGAMLIRQMQTCVATHWEDSSTQSQKLGNTSSMRSFMEDNNNCQCVLCKNMLRRPVMKIDLDAVRGQPNPYSILGLSNKASPQTQPQIDIAYGKQISLIHIDSDDPSAKSHQQLHCISLAKSIL